MGDIRPSSSSPPNSAHSHSSRFANLLTSGHLSDLKILLGSDSFPVHKLILAVSAPNFYHYVLLTAQKRNSFDTVLLDLDNGQRNGHSPDHWSKTFRHFLHFLYTGAAISLKVEEALPLRQLAVRFQVPDLRDQLDAFLGSQFSEDFHISDEEALRVWTQAVKFGDKEVMEKGESFVCRNAWTILASDSDFSLSLTRAELDKILSSGKELVLLSEGQLFKFLLSWATKNDKESDNDAFSTLKKVGLLKHLNLAQLEVETGFLSYDGNHDDQTMTTPNRKYLNSPQTPGYTFSRFPQKFAYCTDNLGDSVEVIRFRADTSLCLLSLGFPTYSQTGANSSFQIELSIIEEGLERQRTSLKKTLPHSTAIQHISFPTPYKIRKNAWYVLEARITGTPGYGNIGGKSLNSVRIKNGNEQVRFELKSESDIGTGQIDEFRFKII